VTRDLEALLTSGSFTWKEELKRPAVTGFWSWTSRKAEEAEQWRGKSMLSSLYNNRFPR
jgi:hypothetical protein